MRIFREGEIVKITDGNAHIGEIDRVVAVSRHDVISYELERCGKWWPHSQLEAVTQD